MAKIAADRASGSGVDGNDIHQAAGVPPDILNPPIPAAQNGTGAAGLGAAADTGGESIAALRELMNKTRYYNPQYVTRLVNTPEVVQRERLTALAAQSEITQDWYNRMEEMVFMEAAMLSDTLDKEHEKPRFSTVKFK
jgi:hypothetical protein